MPRHAAFKWAFRRLHRCRIWLGGRDAHVAEYAKKWPLLYRYLISLNVNGDALTTST